MLRIPIIALFRPKIARAFVGIFNSSDAFDLFDAVFGRRGEA